jgi:hypothetical protein
MIDNLAEADCIEGMSAFLEKRRPTWGRDAVDQSARSQPRGELRHSHKSQ